jgi:hypothetical protein
MASNLLLIVAGYVRLQANSLIDSAHAVGPAFHWMSPAKCASVRLSGPSSMRFGDTGRLQVAVSEAPLPGTMQKRTIALRGAPDTALRHMSTDLSSMRDSAISRRLTRAKDS